MNRREFVAAIGAALSTTSIALAQQQGRTARVGRLSPSSAASDKPIFDAFRAGLRDLGWREGSDVAFEFRFADGQLERLAAAAEQLVRLRVDVIVAGSNPGALAAKNATSDIPVVFITTGDPIAGGLVASLRRPEGNLTGVTTLGSELNAKRLELLKDTFGSRIAVLMHPGASYTEYFRKVADEVAHALALQLRPVEVHDAAQLAHAFDGLGSAENDAIMVLPDIMFITHRQRLVELAGATRIPTMYAERAFSPMPAA
jgi:putative tryptophan/tyrosine transport system substrate-binding protein